MKINIEFNSLDKKYTDEALELAMSAYNDEKKSITYLPDVMDLLPELRNSIDELFSYGTGVVALMNGKLAGYLVGFEVGEFFGKSRGIYCPLYGHGAIKKFNRTIYNELYNHAAQIWVEKSCTSHAITLYAHDSDTIDTWFWQGFGMRCIDAIRKTSLIDANNKDIIIKKVDINSVTDLSDIYRQHNLYYKNSPIFMPRTEEDPIIELGEWLKEENHHMWSAYYDGDPVGFMRIEPEAETFISEHNSIMNITGAYVINEERNSGIGAVLLNSVQQWLIDNSYPLCGVDLESINTIGCNFWTKYFTPYTYSVVRRIDERIL